MIREEQHLNIAMAEGDYGVYLPIEFIFDDDDTETIASTDTFIITIAKVVRNGVLEAKEELLSKSFSGVTDNVLRIFFTEDESKLLPIGQYVYSLDWYREGAFMNNLIERQVFSVRDKVSLEESDES